MVELEEDGGTDAAAQRQRLPRSACSELGRSATGRAGAGLSYAGQGPLVEGGLDVAVVGAPASGSVPLPMRPRLVRDLSAASWAGGSTMTAPRWHPPMAPRPELVRPPVESALEAAPSGALVAALEDRSAPIDLIHLPPGSFLLVDGEPAIMRLDR